MQSKYSWVTKDLLEDLYISQQKSTIQMEQILGVPHGSIYSLLKKNGIPTRSLGEATSIGKIRFPKKQFDNKSLIKAYMLGLRCGDISASRNRRQIMVSCTTTHPAQIEMIRNAFGNYGREYLLPYVYRGRPRWFIAFLLHNTFNFLLKKPEEIPDWILKDNRPFWAFLTGYMDSDGSWKIEKANKNNLRFRFKLATYERQVLMQIKRKLEAFNLYTCFFLDRKKGQKTNYGSYHRNLYALRINQRNDVLRLVRFLMPYSKHTEKIRKMSLILEIKNEMKWIRVKKKVVALSEEIETEVAKCIKAAKEEYFRRKYSLNLSATKTLKLRLPLTL